MKIYSTLVWSASALAFSAQWIPLEDSADVSKLRVDVNIADENKPSDFYFGTIIGQKGDSPFSWGFKTHNGKNVLVYGKGCESGDSKDCHTVQGSSWEKGNQYTLSLKPSGGKWQASFGNGKSVDVDIKPNFQVIETFQIPLFNRDCGEYTSSDFTVYFGDESKPVQYMGSFRDAADPRCSFTSLTMNGRTIYFEQALKREYSKSQPGPIQVIESNEYQRRLLEDWTKSAVDGEETALMDDANWVVETPAAPVETVVSTTAPIPQAGPAKSQVPESPGSQAQESIPEDVVNVPAASHKPPALPAQTSEELINLPAASHKPPAVAPQQTEDSSSEDVVVIPAASHKPPAVPTDTTPYAAPNQGAGIPPPIAPPVFTNFISRPPRPTERTYYLPTTLHVTTINSVPVVEIRPVPTVIAEGDREGRLNYMKTLLEWWF
ncbi:hypothetical protein DICA0_E35322 [Diutina catenulata]